MCEAFGLNPTRSEGIPGFRASGIAALEAPGTPDAPLGWGGRRPASGCLSEISGESRRGVDAPPRRRWWGPGHTAPCRGREWPAYEFLLPLPYRLISPASEFSAFTLYTHTGKLDIDLLVDTGGLEAEYFSAWW